MATYIPGMTDYIPQIQPFVPDYNFLGNVLQTKQSKYDAAHKQMSSLYGSILNAPMSREDNITKRDELFKQIDGQIKQVSGLDLSLQQNQDYAATIFDPIINDEHIKKDMSYTKEWEGQVTRGEGLKLCTDPKTCGDQYWDGGMQVLQYKRKEFMDADPEKALTMSNPSFVSKVDVVGDTMKELTAMKLQVKVDTLSGGMIITDTNGKQMIGTLKDYLTAKYGTDQNVADFYNAQGYLARKNYVSQHAEEVGGEQQALQSYYRELFPEVTTKVKKGKKEAEQNYRRVNALKDAYENTLKTDGVVPSNTTVFDEWENISNAHNAAATSLEVHSNREKNINTAQNNMGDLDAFGALLDQAVGDDMLDKALYNAASSYAILTTEQTQKVNPFALEGMRESFEMNKMQMEKGYMEKNPKTGEMEYHEGLEVAAWKAKEEYKQKLIDDKLLGLFGQNVTGGAAGGASGFINPTLRPDAVGAGGGNKQANLLAAVENKQAIIERYGVLRADQVNYISSVTSNLIEKAKDNPNLNTVLNGMFASVGISGDKLRAGDGDELSKLYTMSDDYKNKVTAFISKNLDPSKTGDYNTISRKWATENWASFATDRVKIQRNINNITEFTNGMKKESVLTAQAVAGFYKSNPGIDSDDVKNANEHTSSKLYGSSFVPIPDRILQNKYKAELSEYLINNSLTGVMPRGKERDQLLRKWAANHKSVSEGGDFRAMYNPKAEHVFFKNDARSQYDNAYQFALDNVDEIDAKFTELYPEYSKSWKGYSGDGMGDISTGKMSSAISFPINWKAGTNNDNNKTMYSVMDNWANLPESERIAKFGDANLYEGFDPEAAAVGMAYFDSMKKSYDIKDKGAPIGDVLMQRVAFSDASKSSFTITPSREWLEETYLSTTPLKEKKALLDKYNKPITFVIPADKANNDFYKKTEVSFEDWKMNYGSGINVNEFPGAGNVQIVKTSNGHLITGNFKWVDKDGVEHMESIYDPKPYTEGLNATLLQDVYTEWFSTLEQANIAQKANAHERLKITGTPAEIAAKLKGK